MHPICDPRSGGGRQEDPREPWTWEHNPNNEIQTGRRELGSSNKARAIEDDGRHWSLASVVTLMDVDTHRDTRVVSRMNQTESNRKESHTWAWWKRDTCQLRSLRYQFSQYLTFEDHTTVGKTGSATEATLFAEFCRVSTKQLPWQCVRVSTIENLPLWFLAPVVMWHTLIQRCRHLRKPQALTKVSGVECPVR